jgi:hypothetical protein
MAGCQTTCTGLLHGTGQTLNFGFASTNREKESRSEARAENSAEEKISRMSIWCGKQANTGTFDAKHGKTSKLRQCNLSYHVK